MRQILAHPDVINAIHPIHIVSFFAQDPHKAFLALGSIFLVVTGGEALYADMGHFGRRPITVAWYGLVLPGLLLNYFGQAALVLDTKEVGALFYRMAPQWGVTPLAILATMASVIASQALISGAFSLTVQAVQLDYLPRVAIRHTSGEHQGQVYVPLVNWALMVGSIGLVVGFGSTSRLAAAYGIAVTSTMVITTILFAVLARGRWGWSRSKVFLVTLPLLIIDSAFFAANVPKIPHGGWFPLLVALVLLVQMATWRRGRDLVAQRIQRGERPIEEVLEETSGVARVAGTAVFLFKDLGKAPPALGSRQGATCARQQPASQQGAPPFDLDRFSGDRRRPPAARCRPSRSLQSLTRRLPGHAPLWLHGRARCPRRTRRDQGPGPGI
jgi:KUP system potassium uptake protein